MSPVGTFKYGKAPQATRVKEVGTFPMRLKLSMREMAGMKDGICLRAQSRECEESSAN
jgi:hypothetical protein